MYQRTELALCYFVKKLCVNELWSGKRGSNSRPPPWQGGALPLSYFRTFINSFVVCRRAAPAVIRLRFQQSIALCLRTSGLNQCCMILYLHCLVFREHRAALSSQLLYLTSSSGSCQELFSEVFRSPGAPSAPWRLSPAGLASPVCRRLFADDLYYITRFLRACQYVFEKNP